MARKLLLSISPFERMRSQPDPHCRYSRPSQSRFPTVRSSTGRDPRAMEGRTGSVHRAEIAAEEEHLAIENQLDDIRAEEARRVEGPGGHPLGRGVEASDRGVPVTTDEPHRAAPLSCHVSTRRARRSR
jgi:hypothetical protein